MSMHHWGRVDIQLSCCSAFDASLALLCRCSPLLANYVLQAFSEVHVGEQLPSKVAQMLYDRIVGASCHPQVRGTAHSQHVLHFLFAGLIVPTAVEAMYHDDAAR
jgi:hypothetical protein